jgi:hypothetical protein
VKVLFAQNLSAFKISQPQCLLEIAPKVAQIPDGFP